MTVKQALNKLRNHNLASLHLEASDAVESYLNADIDKAAAKTYLKGTQKRFKVILKEIDKVLATLKYCPNQVENP